MHLSETGLLLLLIALTLSLLFFDALAFFILAATIRILLLLFTSFLFTLFALIFGCRGGFGLGLRLHLLAHGIFFIVLLLWSTFFGRSTTSKDLRNMGRSVNSSRSGTEHSLEEKVGLIRLVAGDDLRRFHIHLLAYNELSKLDQLD